jgi:hypothetical protein
MMPAAFEREWQEFARRMYVLALGQRRQLADERRTASQSTTVPSTQAGMVGRPHDEWYERSSWDGVLVSAYCLRLGQARLRKEDLDRLVDVLENVIDPDAESSPGICRLIDGMTDAFVRSPYIVGDPPSRYYEFSESDCLAFLERLGASTKSLNVFHSRYGLLRYRFLRALRTHGTDEKLEDDAKALDAEYSSIARPRFEARFQELWPVRVPTTSRPGLPASRPAMATSRERQMEFAARSGVDELDRAIKKLRRSIEEQHGTTKPAYSWVPFDDSVATLGRLRFREIPLRVRLPSGGASPLQKTGWVSGRELASWSAKPRRLANAGSFDVFWGPGVVAFMRRPGWIEVVHVDPDAVLDDAKWDGAHLWVATQRKGIWVLSPTGDVTARIASAEGLPPCDNGIRIHAIEPGRVLAVGSFGKHMRAWCAIADLNSPDPRVRVFHQATEAAFTGSPPGVAYSENPVQTFVPLWTHEFDTGNPGADRCVLIGRRGRSDVPLKAPLEINLTTLAVSVPNLDANDAELNYDDQTSDSLCSVRGELLQVTSSWVKHRAPSGRKWANGKAWRILCEGKPIGSQLIGLKSLLLPYHGYVYVPGNAWFRIDPTTLKEERLVPTILPKEYDGLPFYGVSAHYGLVAWSYWGQFYQVLVDEPQTPESRPAVDAKREE